MVAKQQDITYEEIVRRIRAKDFSPVYYLMGEEPYYIDKISDYIVDTVLSPEERDFNLTILYGQGTSMNTVVDAARRFPVMATHQVVLVKEAQHIDDKDRLAEYLQKPQTSTILIFCHKNGSLDRRKKIAEEIKNKGVLYESRRLYDTQLPVFISSYLKRQGFQIESQAALILSNYVGSDLCRMAGELDKLTVAVTGGRNLITAEDVETRVGISKEFNNFELLNALVEKDIYKANLIVKYYNSNPKSFSLQVTLSVLFNFYSNLMQAYYAPQKTDEGIAQWLEQPKWQVSRNIVPAMKKYSGVKVMKIISEIRNADIRSKGIESTGNTTPGQLLQDLVFFILH